MCRTFKEFTFDGRADNEHRDETKPPPCLQFAVRVFCGNRNEMKVLVNMEREETIEGVATRMQLELLEPRTGLELFQ